MSEGFWGSTNRLIGMVGRLITCQAAPNALVNEEISSMKAKSDLLAVIGSHKQVGWHGGGIGNLPGSAKGVGHRLPCASRASDEDTLDASGSCCPLHNSAKITIINSASFVKRLLHLYTVYHSQSCHSYRDGTENKWEKPRGGKSDVFDDYAPHIANQVAHA